MCTDIFYYCKKCARVKDFWSWQSDIQCETCHVDMVSTGIDATQWHREARSIKEAEIAEEIARKNPEYDPALEAERKEKDAASLHAMCVAEATTNRYIPKCPTCGSPKIHKISTASKVASVALVGIFSRKVHKQWHCDNCGSEW